MFKTATKFAKSNEDSNKHLRNNSSDKNISGQPSFFTSNNLLLQRKAGCACGGGCLSCQNKSTNLQVSQPNDASEIEADQIADKVMRTQVAKSASDQIKSKSLSESVTPIIQTKTEGSNSVSDSLRNKITHSRGGGSDLDIGVQSFMQNRFSANFSGVKIHTGSDAIQMNRELNSRAFTIGNDIYFNDGQYQPTSKSGKHLLAHELTHVLQQTGKNGATISKMIQRQTMPCTGLLNAPGSSVGGVAAHSVIVADFNSKVAGATTISIPGASAKPQRTEGTPRQKDMIDPQVIGGRGGIGFPDLARKNATALEIGEIKPADYFWVAEGLAQLSRYIENGNATDPQQQTWRNANGISLVSPLLPNVYSPPPTLLVGNIPIQVAWCGPGLIVYKATTVTVPPPPVWQPQPQWDKVLFLSMLAAMALAAAKTAGKKLNPAYRYASIVAIIYLLGSGKAEAKVSLDGDDPLEALFKSMEQNGVQVPPEVQEMIKNDPELKKMIEESAKKGGNLSDVQKEVAKKYSEYISQHINEFSKEELEAILSTTESVSDKMPDDVNVEDIKKAIKNKSKEKGGADDTPKTEDNKSGGDNTDKKSVSDVKDKPPVSDEELNKKYPKLSTDSKKKIKESSQPVTELLQEFASGETGKARLDDSAVKRFFEIVPPDLTKEQSEILISRMISSKDKTADELFEALKKGIEEIRKAGDEAEGETSEESTSPTDSNQPPAKTREQIISELQEKAKNTDFKNVPEAKTQFRQINKKVKDGKLSSYVYGKVKGMGMVAYITAEVVPASLDVNNLKSGESFKIKIISQSPFVDKNGKVYDLKVTKTIKITK